MRMLSVILSILLILGISMAQEKKAPSIKLHVTGMTCGGCAGKVTSALKGIEGVKDAKVDLKNEMAEVTLAEGVKVTEDILIKAVTDAGYQASVAKDDVKKAVPKKSTKKN
jgi:copper chaperone CopZ